MLIVDPGSPSQDELNAKTALRLGDKKVLNVYACAPRYQDPQQGLIEIAGFGTFPSQQSSNPIRDGVVLHYNALPGGADLMHNLGHYGPHEVGHWLGLSHVFNGACVAPDDFVVDTPRQVAKTQGCPSSAPNTCPADPGLDPDPIENFMDNTCDAIRYKFTQGQSDRMDAQTMQYRFN